MINKEELLEKIEEKYGSLDNEMGCGCYVNGEYVWLSIAAIVELIEECEEYEE